MTTNGTSTPTPEVDVDVDVVVVGSGFGGSVTALRLAEKGYRVLVLEAGRRFEDDDFAKTSWDTKNYLWAPQVGCYGIQRIHRLPDVVVLAGAGVGGGSLNYANTLYVPPSPFFQDEQWADITDWESELAPHYETASRMLGVVTNPCHGVVEELMQRTADDLGVGGSFRKTPVGVFFGAPGETVDDPYFGGVGPKRTGCTECGNCMVGCRVGAKNTLRKNYLALAENLGVTIEPMRTVTRLGVVPGTEGDDATYRVLHERTGPVTGRDVQVVTARRVVLAAGAWGTQTLLHEMKAVGELPGLSDYLGHRTRTNSEALLGAMAQHVPTGDKDLTRGGAITSSFHVDETTHVENCRYGKGSNAMGLLATIAVPGGTGRPRWVELLRKVGRDPMGFLRLMPIPRHWSERMIIGLVMQSRDNSLHVTGKRGLLGRPGLTSRQGHGHPNPTYIPQGHEAMQALAKRLGEATGDYTAAGGSWFEVFDVPMTAHFLGGATIGSSPERGVVDGYHRVWGYPGISVVDGSAVSANLGVNPSLTITAQAERAMSLWPNRGDADPRPAQDEPYAVLAPVRARRPAVPLGFPVRVEPVVSAASVASASRIAPGAGAGSGGSGPRSADRVSVGGATMGG
jgi:cholesterol oxidase